MMSFVDVSADADITQVCTRTGNDETDTVDSEDNVDMAES